jgi:hypothetical protein
MTGRELLVVGFPGTVAAAATDTLLEPLEGAPTEVGTLVPVAGTGVDVPPVVQSPVVPLQTSGVGAATPLGVMPLVPLEDAPVPFVAMPEPLAALPLPTLTLVDALFRICNVHPPTDIDLDGAEEVEKLRHQPPAVVELFSLLCMYNDHVPLALCGVALGVAVWHSNTGIACSWISGAAPGRPTPRLDESGPAVKTYGPENADDGMLEFAVGEPLVAGVCGTARITMFKGLAGAVGLALPGFLDNKYAATAPPLAIGRIYFSFVPPAAVVTDVPVAVPCVPVGVAG